MAARWEMLVRHQHKQRAGQIATPSKKVHTHLFNDNRGDGGVATGVEVHAATVTFAQQGLVTEQLHVGQRRRGAVYKDAGTTRANVAVHAHVVHVQVGGVDGNAATGVRGNVACQVQQRQKDAAQVPASQEHSAAHPRRVVVVHRRLKGAHFDAGIICVAARGPRQAMPALL